MKRAITGSTLSSRQSERARQEAESLGTALTMAEPRAIARCPSPCLSCGGRSAGATGSQGQCAGAAQPATAGDGEAAAERPGGAPAVGVVGACFSASAFTSLRLSW